MNKKQIDAQLSNALKRVLFNKGKLGKNIYLKKFGITRMECQKIFSSHFLEGMSWNNHGIWWIDHLTPKSWFYYTNIDDAEVWNCWHIDNLRPKWSYHNIKKSDRFSDQEH